MASLTPGEIIKAISLNVAGSISNDDLRTLLGINVTINPQVDNYTMALTDVGALVTLNNVGAKTLYINTDAAVDFIVGTVLTVAQIGAGQYTIQATDAGTTTIVSTGATAAAPKLRVRYASASLIKLAANSWIVVGDIA